MEESKININKNHQCTETHQDFERITELVCKYFNEKVPKKGKPIAEEWTTLAAIVQSENETSDTITSGSSSCAPTYKIVALGTGTKCIGKNELSPLGDVLSDSHAEIVCRRAFLLYLYDQLFLTMSNDGPNQQTIFQITKNNSTENPHSTSSSSSPFTLRPEIKFHLFVSHIPCGDAAIFDIPEADANLIEKGTTEQENKEDINECPAKKCKIVDEESSSTINTTDSSSTTTIGHRTGAKLIAGDSTYENVQVSGRCRVKPGKGDPTISMSCSDKIAKWNIMGVQGSLLGNFIRKPITFQSIIIGKLDHFDSRSIKRAIYDRFHIDCKSQLEQCLSKYFQYMAENSKDFNLEQELQPSPVPEIHQSSKNFMILPTNGDGRPAPASISGYLTTKTNGFKIDVSVSGRKQGANKKVFGKPISQVHICRRKLFLQFIQSCKKYEQVFTTPLIPSDHLHSKLGSDNNEGNQSVSYLEAKKFNSIYYETWNSLKSNVMIGWTTKPEHMSLFTVSLDDVV